MAGIGPMGGPTGGDSPKSSGFRTLLYVLVGVGAVLVLTCGAAFFFAARNPAIRKAFDAAMASSSAPGAAELRAAGCSQAMVMDLAGAFEAIAQLADAEGSPEAENLPPVFVNCQLASDDAEGAGLDCDEVARVYIDSVGTAPGRFLAQVSVGFSGNAKCQAVYSAEGDRLGRLEDLAQ